MDRGDQNTAEHGTVDSDLSARDTAPTGPAADHPAIPLADNRLSGTPMQIKRLKLSGFKSFVEASELHIEPGLTGVVGPNGCGKSNLLEAIRWVMGESSPKSMRGGGMEDVIFAGTADRPQRNFAEVTLLAEVSHAVLPGIDPNDGELEITRRIERGAGSAYRANGRDVRAKDVALIFADAATGAHSPALVSQGKIAGVIAAKPAARRQMLEEAAGISGLHVRRKDAEQKLRATEANLERLQQILGDMELRAGQLRKQAAAAERYRKLSAQITSAEARTVYARWRDAASAAEKAKFDAQTADQQVSQCQTAQQAVQETHNQSVHQVAEARAAMQADRDRANDLGHKLLSLQNDLDSVRRRISDLDRQTSQISSDSEREDRLTHDAANALSSLEEESASLQVKITGGEAQQPELARDFDRAERAMRESEVALAKATAEEARADADIKMAGATLANARTRFERCQRDSERTLAQLEQLGEADRLVALRDQAQTEKDAAITALEAARKALSDLESQREPLASAREEQESAVSSARAELNTMARQINALTRDLAAHHNDDQALDQLRADKGFEKALAAALGDDLSASIVVDGTAALGDGRFWTATGHAVTESANTPVDAVRLLDHVKAPAALHARLAQIFVTQNDAGQALQTGQRLVTFEGRLRRWDGFVSSGDGASSAERLAQRNRLDDLQNARPALAEQVEHSARNLADTQARISELQDRIKKASVTRDAASAAERDALRVLDQAEFALARDGERRDDLETQIEMAVIERDAAKAELDEAQKQFDALPDGRAQKQVVITLTAQNEAAKLALRSAQASQSALQQQLSGHRERRAVIRAEIKGWQARSSEAAQRMHDMRKRATALQAERQQIADRPAEIEARIAGEKSAQLQVNERLAALQHTSDAADAALKTAEAHLAQAAEALSAAREARAGAAARAEHQDQRRIEMAQLSGERFECPPPLLPERQNFDAQGVRDAETEASEHDRLTQSRERLGAVNLIAADELAALESEMAQNRQEHDELLEAVNRLRGSIGALNREGRQRLLAAFAAVDGHFQRLFARLFNGGKAHLKLVDSDDPLEAGLEIMAQPPGKRLSSLTLLSGGEQALTAVALIFGLFLTNPAPICVLDEVDAPLDDANIERFCDLLDFMVGETKTRYLIVTHNAVTMSRMHRLFGVTMIEKGVSRLVSVDLGTAEELLAAE